MIWKFGFYIQYKVHDYEPAFRKDQSNSSGYPQREELYARAIIREETEIHSSYYQHAPELYLFSFRLTAMLLQLVPRHAGPATNEFLVSKLGITNCGVTPPHINNIN